MENNQTIGAKILALRKTRGVTQADLGAYLNISYQAVSKWERDESCPDFETLCKVAQFFNVPITYFEKGGETAVLSTPSTDAKNARVMVGVCKECGKVIYEGEEAKNVTPLMCKDCHAVLSERKARLEKQYADAVKKEEAVKKQKQIKRAKDIKRGRNRGLIWSGIITGFLLIASIISAVNNKEYASIGLAFLGAVFVYAYIAQLFWDGWVFDCTFFGGKVIGTPGIIFTFDWDGFKFLIAMKIFFALLRFLVLAITTIASALIAFISAPFTFVPALLRVNAGDLVD